MSYRHTDVLVYGVPVSHAEAKALVIELGEAVFELDRANDFLAVKQEWPKVETWNLEVAYEGLKDGYVAEVGGVGGFSDLAGFFDLLGFASRIVPKPEVETITRSSQGRSYSRQRYNVDVVCDDADSRGDSLRYLPGHDSYFGVVLGSNSNGYGYPDDLGQLAAAFDPRVPRNFERYCRPPLVAQSWERQPALRTVGQIW